MAVTLTLVELERWLDSRASPHARAIARQQVKYALNQHIHDYHSNRGQKGGTRHD